MSKNKFEDDLLKEVNIMNEGIAIRVLKWLMKSKVKKAFKALEDDPEMKAAVNDMNYQAKKVKKMLKKHGEEGINPELVKIIKNL